MGCDVVTVDGKHSRVPRVLACRVAEAARAPVLPGPAAADPRAAILHDSIAHLLQLFLVSRSFFLSSWHCSVVPEGE